MHIHHTPNYSLDDAKMSCAISAAKHRGQGLARRITDPARDCEDHHQDILVDFITRAGRFDPGRGSWGAFVTVVMRNASFNILAQRSLAVVRGCDVDELMLEPLGHHEQAVVTMIDARALQRRLPHSLRNILASIAETGSVTDVQRASGHSSASFYRALRQLRLRLIAAGLAPARIVNTRPVAPIN